MTDSMKPMSRIPSFRTRSSNTIVRLAQRKIVIHEKAYLYYLNALLATAISAFNN